MSRFEKSMTIFAHKENTENEDKEYIHFTEPYYRIAGKENFQNQTLNEALSHCIYSSLQDNIDYITTTQYNTDQNNKYQVKNIERALDKITKKNRSIIPNNNCIYQKQKEHIESSNKVLNNSELKLIEKNRDNKTHNILKLNKDNIEIIHHIPSLNIHEAIQLEKLQNSHISDITKDTMNNLRYNDYPPANGLSYNKNTMLNNGEDYYTKNNLNQIPTPVLQQQNIHGRNDLLFPEGQAPYGLYDQSNFAGTNALMCGPMDAQNIRMVNRGHSVRENYGNEYSGNCSTNGMNGINNMNGMNGINGINGMNGMYQPNKMYHPNKYMDMNRNFEQLQTCEAINGQNIAMQKNRIYSSNNNINVKDKKDLNRKNMSKLKKGMIDINIETSSSNRQGVTIDLNIGVGN